MPALPADHRDHNRRHEARISAQNKNRSNDEKRFHLVMEARTELYTLLKTCTETSAPVLTRQLKNRCDLSSVPGVPAGYYDGPLAWRMVQDKLKTTHKPEVDKDFYRTAERLQRQNPLPDGCTADEYSKKAFAFLVPRDR